jgi:hypothetical protein
MLARGLVHLYAGEGARLFARCERDWPALRRSGLLVGKIVSHQLVWIRAAAAIEVALAKGAERAAPLLAAAERHAKKLAKNPVLGSAPMASCLLAAIARARGDADSAATRLAAAADAYDALDMRAFAAAARWQLGRLRGGEEGASVVADADAFFAREGVVKPARFASMLTPGFPRD